MTQLGLDEAMGRLEKQGLEVKPMLLGDEKRGVFGCSTSVDNATYSLPGASYHTITLTPGCIFDLNVEKGLINRKKSNRAAEGPIFVPAGNSCTWRLAQPASGGSGSPARKIAHFALYMNKALVNSVFEDVGRRDVDPDKVMPGLSSVASTRFRWLASAIQTEMSHERCGKRSMLDALIDALIVELVRSYENVKSQLESVKQFTENERLAVANLIESAIDSSVSIRDISDAMQLSPATFTRRFRATFNAAPKDYLLHQRLDRARNILVSTEVKIAEIAYECGFNSQSHFTTRFSEAFDTTPARYRASVWNRSSP